MTMSNGSNGGLPELNVLSNRADLVSGGDALVQVVLPGRVDPSTVRVSVDGRDVTSAFAVRAGGAYEGVVTGLANGANDLMATMKNGPTVHLTVTNHPSGGPVFAGARCSRGSARRSPASRCRRTRSVTARRSSRSSTWTPFRTRSSRIAAAVPARVDRDDDDGPGSVGAVHRPPRARCDGSRALRRRRAREPGRQLGALGVAAGLEPQGAVPVRRRHRSVAHERRAVERPRRPRALARVHGREQQPQHPRRQRERRRLRGSDDDAEGARRRDVRLDPLHDRRRLLGRLDPAVRDRGQLSGAARRHPAELQLHRTAGRRRTR